MVSLLYLPVGPWMIGTEKVHSQIAISARRAGIGVDSNRAANVPGDLHSLAGYAGFGLTDGASGGSQRLSQCMGTRLD